MSSNWLAGELTCPTSLHDVGQYRTYLTRTNINSFNLVLVQTVKDSDQTSGLCTLEI